MDSATQDLFYQKINEYIFDEEKIVTNAFLVRNLKIQLNEAKTLLTAYVNDHSDSPSTELCKTYLLSGFLKANKGLAFYLVKEDDLIEKRSLFETVSSEIIFSLQKNEPADFNTIALADKANLDPAHDTTLGNIVGHNCVKREIQERSIPVPVTKPPEPVKETKSFFKKLPVNNNTSQRTKTDNKTSENSKADNNTSQKTNGQENVKKELSQDNSVKKAKPGSITSFFSKAPGNSISTVKTSSQSNDEFVLSKNENKEESDKSNNISKEQADEKENSPEEKMDLDETLTKDTEVKQENSNTTKKRKKKKNAKNDAPTKKRKRIQEVCDSDSSDIFEDEDNEDIIENSYNEPDSPTPTPVLKPVPAAKRKVRKAVDKTYVDDEGFMVTTTEYIYESGPEEVEEKVEKKEVPETKSKPLMEKKNSTTDSENDSKSLKGKGKGKKNKKPVTGKQTTLMNFFKKS